MELDQYLKTLLPDDREAFGNRVGASVAYLRLIGYGGRNCGEKLAIAIERESNRAVTCEELRPDVDWAYLRKTAEPTKRKGEHAPS